MDNRIIITKKDQNFLKVSCSGSVAYELYEHFSFMVPGAKYMPQYRMGRWDGFIRLFSPENRSLPVGLLVDLFKFAARSGLPIEFDKEDFRSDFSPDDIQQYKDRLGDLIKFDLSGKYRYQWDAAQKCLEMSRLLVKSPTSSGKSAIIYLITRFLLENTEGDVLICVPKISLTEQLIGDFESYVNDGLVIKDHVSVLYSGKPVLETRVLISTWQSIFKKPQEFFDRFTGGFICDEAHLADSKSITSIIHRLPNTKVKLGFTGTISESKCSEMQLKGLFGPVYSTKTTRELQDEGILSDLKINVVSLGYDPDVKSAFWKSCPEFKDEVSWLASNPFRNKYIADLAMEQAPKNTLILYNFISHGKEILKLIKEHREDNVFLVNGSTPPDRREEIRRIAEENTGVIIVASSALFSTGVNIRNLTTLIFAHSFKAKIRNLQSIGRSLRLHSDKETAVLYDITDDLRVGRKANITYRHMIERLKIYQNEGFKYQVIEKSLANQVND